MDFATNRNCFRGGVQNMAPGTYIYWRPLMELSMSCRPVVSTSRLLTTLVLLAGLAACGGGGWSAPAAPSGMETLPPVVVPVTNPTAAFAAPSVATAQTQIAFDASGSTSADGSARPDETVGDETQRRSAGDTALPSNHPSAWRCA